MEVGEIEATHWHQPLPAVITTTADSRLRILAGSFLQRGTTDFHRHDV